jgi:hypothetical protein
MGMPGTARKKTRNLQKHSLRLATKPWVFPYTMKVFGGGKMQAERQYAIPLPGASHGAA